ncbi:TlpA family protein disulfide reductase [Actinoplanes sp. RD1]|uniref:TlpA family protein disulfide reductase n=1 Tax=Actinoplanes sp. RD1 TaxID=3064538 RepID=UPI002742215B|nr:thioredoxin family protein [Actinoplanes sp. RD1]
MNSTGLIVAAAVLVLGVAAGLWHRRADGRLRGTRPIGGLPEPTTSEQATGPATEGAALDGALLDGLGVGPAAATLLQFSSAACAPCRALRRLSAEVAEQLPGVRHVDVDAESHLDAVRALGIWRTPTLLVLDADGRIVRRATGVPAKPDLLAAVEPLLPR